MAGLASELSCVWLQRPYRFALCYMWPSSFSPSPREAPLDLCGKSEKEMILSWVPLAPPPPRRRCLVALLELLPTQSGRNHDCITRRMKQCKLYKIDPSCHGYGILRNIWIASRPPPPFVFFLKSIMFWMDKCEVITGLPLMSLMEIGNFYRTGCLIVVSPCCYKKLKDSATFKIITVRFGVEGPLCSKRFNTSA